MWGLDERLVSSDVWRNLSVMTSRTNGICRSSCRVRFVT